MHLPMSWLLPPCWKAGQLPKASAKVLRQRAEDTTCFRCNVVSKVAEYTQNHLQQLQLKSAMNQETVMWKTKCVFFRPLLLHSPHPPSHCSFAFSQRSNFNSSNWAYIGHYWACFTSCCVPKTFTSIFSLQTPV